MGSHTSRPVTKTPTILVVEEEAIVRLAIAAYLRDVGWHVLEAGDSQEARQILYVSQSIDAVFADAQVPGKLDGLDLAIWIQRHYPDLLIVLTSDDTGIIQGLRASGAIPLVMKPYAPQDVAHRLSALLAEIDARRELAVAQAIETGVDSSLASSA